MRADEVDRNRVLRCVKGQATEFRIFAHERPWLVLPRRSFSLRLQKATEHPRQEAIQ